MADSSHFERDMQHLDAEIRRLEAEYSQFFSGRLKQLPWKTRARVDALVRQYDRSPLRNTAEKFRFGTLQARFASFCELWDRTLKAKEEGRTPPRRGAMTGATGARPSAPATSAPAFPSPEPAVALPATPPVAPTTPAPLPVAAGSSRVDAEQRRADGLVAEGRFRGAPETTAVRELHARLNGVREALGEAPVSYERFATLVSSQVAKIGGGEGTVAFRVAVRDGKVSLTARAMRDEDAE